MIVVINVALMTSKRLDVFPEDLQQLYENVTYLSTFPQLLSRPDLTPVPVGQICDGDPNFPWLISTG